MGKTEIELELCHRERTTFSVIVWIDGEGITDGVLEFANKLSNGQKTFNNREE